MFKPKTQKADKISFIEINDEMFIPRTFQGTMSELLPFAAANPATMESAHMRGFRLIARQGVDPVETEKARRTWGDQNLFAYKAFGDFYGLEPTIHRLMSNLGSGALGGEPGYSIFFLVGPPSSGKSQIANRMKYIYASGEPALMLADSQMRAHPLSLLRMIPMLVDQHSTGKSAAERAALRGEFLQALGLQDALRFDRYDVKQIFARYGVETPDFEALCKVEDADAFVSALVYGLGFSRGVRSIVTFPDFAVIDRCLASTDPAKDLANWRIDSFRFLGEKEGSVGIASLKESEPLKYDKSEMVGEDDLNRFALDRPEDHEQVILNGLYNRGNRGMAEIVEAAKNSIMAFRTMLDASQDKSVPAPAPKSNRALGVDLVIFAHTNEDELRKMLADPGNAPYKDRFVRLNTPHAVPAPKVAQVLNKLYQRGDASNPESPAYVALEPNIMPMMGRYLAFTRQLPDREVKDPMTQIEILSGDYFRLKETGTKYNVQDLLRRAGSRQGMSGETNRFAIKVIEEQVGSAFLNRRHSLTSEEVYEGLIAAIRREREDMGEDVSKDETGTPSSKLGQYEAFVKGALAKWRAKQLARDVRLAMVANNDGSDLRESFTSRYVEAVENWLADESSVSAEDKAYVRDVEAQLGVSSAQADRFREELRQFRSKVLDARDAYAQKHGDEAVLPHNFYPPLKKAIDRIIIKRMQPSVVISVLRAEKTGTEAQKKQLQGTIGRMVELLGYTAENAKSVIDEVERKGYLDLLDTDDED